MTTENNENAATVDEVGAVNESQATTKQSLTSAPAIVYWAYLAGLVTGVFFIAGVILAYVAGDKYDSPMLQTHRRYQVKTFWYGLIGSIISFVLSFVVIGYFLMIAIGIWMLIRISKGLSSLSSGKPI